LGSVSRSIRSQPLPDLAQAVVGHGAPVVVVTGTVVAVVVVTGTVVAVVVVTGTVVAVVVVAGTVVVVLATVVVVGGMVVVDRGNVVLVVAPRVVAVVATVLLVVAVVVGGLAVVTTKVPGGTVGAVMSVVPLASVLTNAVRPDPCTANVVVVDRGEVAADAPADAARGAAAATDVGNGTNGTPFALSVRTGPSVGAREGWESQPNITLATMATAKPRTILRALCGS
jgi:hypothetical protein